MREEYIRRQSEISRQMAWIGFAIMSAWFLGDLIDRGPFLALLLEASTALSFLAVILLFRAGKSELGRWGVILACNGTVFVGAIFFTKDVGSTYTFIPLVALPWVVFPPEDRRAVRLTSLLPVLLLFLWENPFFEKLIPWDPIPGNKWYFYANVAAAFITTYFITGFYSSFTRETVDMEKKAAEARLERVVNTHLIGVARGDANGKIFEANDTLLAMFGYTRQELNEGKLNFVSRTTPESVAVTKAAWEQVKRTGRCDTFEKEYFTKSGARLPVLLGIASLDETNSENCLAFFLDITAQKRLQQTQEAVRARDEFASIASHELKTPLTSLNLQIEILKGLIETKPHERELAMKIVRESEFATKRMNRLVDLLLDWTRIRAGKLEIVPQLMNLADTAHQIIADFETSRLAAPSQISLDSIEDAEGFWDPIRMSQVMTNLISNAIKYGRGKPIRVRIFALENPGTERRIVLEVQDQGHGIPEDKQQMIFNKFERAVNSDQRTSGLGLGLYVVRGIVEAHRGKVSVSSQPEAGSTFRVELPTAEA